MGSKGYVLVIGFNLARTGPLPSSSELLSVSSGQSSSSSSRAWSNCTKASLVASSAPWPAPSRFARLVGRRGHGDGQSAGLNHPDFSSGSVTPRWVRTSGFQDVGWTSDRGGKSHTRRSREKGEPNHKCNVGERVSRSSSFSRRRRSRYRLHS